MADKTTTPPTADKTSPMEMQARTLQSLGWFGNTWAATLGALGAELGEFIALRIAEDVKTQHAMLNCRSLAELQAVHADFIRDAIAQYTAETGKLVRLQQDLIERLSRPPTD